ncbi:hypothetical protein PRIPAC_97943 [Pristionchus pacificus]|uniref:Uncharacterized protein n=1 Tax=Pristionchus pacificus TaxID=54126 RepID=A0A2A6D2N2_PRIPA|nr:hypothetical protein PRIPAC_97943 [Pristionchus pacificus]|eukprot:PDM84732.1 hypothetical protein PRIPAC_33755 [Pristionchus pacificus]
MSRTTLVLLSLALAISAIQFRGSDPSYEGRSVWLCGARLLEYIIDLELSQSCTAASKVFAPLSSDRVAELKQLNGRIYEECCSKMCTDRIIYNMLCENRV